MRPSPLARRPLARAVTGAVLATALLAPLAGLTGTASAAVAVPTSPTFSASIDAYPRYERENTCSPTEKPGPQFVRTMLRSTYGTSIGSNIVRSCTSSDSGHEEGRALDWMTSVRVASQRDMANAFIGWLQATDKYGNKHAMVRRLGIQYIIWNNRMWRTYDPSRGWTEYAGCLDPAKASTTYDNACHRNHVHLSFSWDGAWKRTSYYAGNLTCPAPSDPAAFTGAPPTNLTAVPIPPARLLDTRAGANACRLGGGGRIDLKVTGVGGVPSTGVGAVVLNLTGTNPSGGTYLSAYPTGTTWPGTSSVNLPAGGTAAALVTVPVGSDGKVSIRNGSSPVDVVVDVVAYFATGTGWTYSDVPAQRVLDTRKTAALAAGEWRRVAVEGSYGVPSGARGVLVNVTATGSTRAGYLTVAPVSGATTSTVNFGAGDIVANRALVQLADDGSLEVFANTTTHAVIDIVGWFGPGGDALHFNALLPTRILDTRNGTGGLGALTGGTQSTLQVAGHGGVPADARSVVATLTVTQPSSSSYAATWAADARPPGTSDLNLAAGSTRANLVAPSLSAQGAAALTINSGTAQAVVDVLGYFR